jgi:hypothetical protein
MHSRVFTHRIVSRGNQYSFLGTSNSFSDHGGGTLDDLLDNEDVALLDQDQRLTIINNMSLL